MDQRRALPHVIVPADVQSFVGRSLTFLKRHTLKGFAYYRILLRLAVLRMFG